MKTERTFEFKHYNQMLERLSAIDGYDSFLTKIQESRENRNDFRAEVKALFEVNKPHHPLFKISSAEHKEPEGHFTILETNQNGIVESAFLRDYVTNDNAGKFANNLEQRLGNVMTGVLSDNPESLIEIGLLSFLAQPSARCYKEIKTIIHEFFNNSTENHIHHNMDGLVVLHCSKDKTNAQSIGNDFECLFRPHLYNGRLSLSFNFREYDFDQKIKSVIKAKRNQWKEYYEDGITMVILYLLTDSTPRYVNEINLSALVDGKKNEVIVLCAEWEESDGNGGTIRREIKKTLPPNLDFSNDYLESFSGWVVDGVPITDRPMVIKLQ
jgi:hypothetical protein